MLKLRDAFVAVMRGEAAEDGDRVERREGKVDDGKARTNTSRAGVRLGCVWRGCRRVGKTEGGGGGDAAEAGGSGDSLIFTFGN